MNRSILRYSVLIIIALTFFLSCKKTNPLHPTPSNYRMLSFSEVTTTGAFGSYVYFNENYKFTYDKYNRVAQITYTTNIPLNPNLVSYLTYSNDTIYDSIRQVNFVLVEVDTFITDAHGNITKTYMPGGPVAYSYLNNLLTRVTYNDTTYSILNSFYGNFNTLIPSRNYADTGAFVYYTDLHNRPGDYFQLQSFARYGYNFYQNADLIRFLHYGPQSTSVTYVIDADSKITQTTAKVVDTTGDYLTPTAYLDDTVTKVYDIQYETYSAN